MIFTNVLLGTRRALLLCKVYSDSALLVMISRTSLNSSNALLALSQRYNEFSYFMYGLVQLKAHQKTVFLNFRVGESNKFSTTQ